MRSDSEESTPSSPRKSASFCEPDPCSNPDIRQPIRQVMSRRMALRQAAGTVAAGMLYRSTASADDQPRGISCPSSLTFRELEHGLDDGVSVADGYEAQILLRWGDPITPTAQDLDPLSQSAESQSSQFGYNCDFTTFLPLPKTRDGLLRGLLCVNHEYVDSNLMFPGIVDVDCLCRMPIEQVEVEMAALGHTVVEVRQRDGRWEVFRSSRYNRRLTALDTMVDVSGPAAEHPRLRTSQDPTGRRVTGTLNNCAGGVTPWGTMLICEENFNEYFGGSAAGSDEAGNHSRYGIPEVSEYFPSWARQFSRFDVSKEPNEPNRFGWVVEFDPYDPESAPVKRTALGRFKHEGAGVVVNHDGRVVIYCGDDEKFEYVYRFVSKRAYDPHDKAANANLLDEGTLYAGRFDDKGQVTWCPLVHGQGPLTSENGFHSQADVLIETRRAADLVGATPMDRPEEVEASGKTGHVFLVLTNNAERSEDQADAANPRPGNVHGHILELIPPARAGGLDHAADTYRWEPFLRAGDPRDPQHNAQYHPQTSSNGWFSGPDNIMFDSEGRLWLTTDGADEAGFADGIYACDTSGPGRALPKLFFRGPKGSEISGISMTPDNETIFVSVQHPGEGEGSDFQSPSTRWPDFSEDMPPRPSVVAITRKGGGRLGS